LLRGPPQRHPPTHSGQFFIVSAGSYLVFLTVYDIYCRRFDHDV
jgi:hypothetical protein